MSKRECTKALYKCAKRLRRVFTRGDGLKDENYPERVRELLEAAVAWRDEAKRVAEGKGRGRERPDFTRVPDNPNPHAPPSVRQYRNSMAFWASHYAWDKADGLPVEEAALKLMQTAIVGTYEGFVQRRKRAQHERATTTTA